MTQQNCDDLASRLDELIAGRLDEPDSAAIRSHVASCDRCRIELEQRRRLADAIHSLPRTIEPARDLWPEIRQRLEPRVVVPGRFRRARPPIWARVRLAAAAAAILAVSITAAYLIGVEHGRPKVVSTSDAAPGLVPVSAPDVDDDLERVTVELRARLDERRDELSPETWSVVMDNVAVIDRAIDRIELALADHPNDRRLNLQLAVAYRRQIDLLRRATVLPADV
ncbi:MAG: zf-HC2 domain-containing protein [Holophagae bacterium]|jgi:hypothetical protein